MEILTEEQVREFTGEVLLQKYRSNLSSLVWGGIGLAAAAVSHESVKNDPCQANIDLLEKEILSRFDSLVSFKDMLSFTNRSSIYSVGWPSHEIDKL